MENASFIKLYLNDFDSAKKSDDMPITFRQNNGVPYSGFIQQLPNEYFLQITAGTTAVTFVAGIRVDLIDGCGNVKKNIDANFYYEGAVDSNGIEQIAFAFGYIGQDFWTEPLHLKITDLINDNVWYSNNFLVTNYNSELSGVIHYSNPTKIFNISYDLLPYTQNVRIADFYESEPNDETSNKQYTQSQGNLVAYRETITDLDTYTFSAIDKFAFRRLERVFAHALVYINGKRVVKKDFKKDKRVGNTNWFPAELTVNPQSEVLTVGNQLYEYLDVVSLLPAHQGVYTLDTLPNLSITFNKNITLLPGFEIQLYKDGVLQTIAPATYTPTGNVLDIIPSYIFSNGDYKIVVPSDKIVSGAEIFKGISIGNWNFTVQDGDYDNTQYSNDYLLN